MRSLPLNSDQQLNPAIGTPRLCQFGTFIDAHEAGKVASLRLTRQEWKDQEAERKRVAQAWRMLRSNHAELQSAANVCVAKQVNEARATEAAVTAATTAADKRVAMIPGCHVLRQANTLSGLDHNLAHLPSIETVYARRSLSALLQHWTCCHDGIGRRSGSAQRAAYLKSLGWFWRSGAAGALPIGGAYRRCRPLHRLSLMVPVTTASLVMSDVGHLRHLPTVVPCPVLRL